MKPGTFQFKYLFAFAVVTAAVFFCFSPETAAACTVTCSYDNCPNTIGVSSGASLLRYYDKSGNGYISSSEAASAVSDYSSGKITVEEALFVLSCYGSGKSISAFCASCTDECSSSGCDGAYYNDCYDSDGDGCTESHWDNCSDCSCSCGGYGEEESSGNGNCSDGLDNDCDGNTDSEDCGCCSVSCSQDSCPNVIGAGSGCGLLLYYDIDDNNQISGNEVNAALNDYSFGRICVSEALFVLGCYGSGQSVSEYCHCCGCSVYCGSDNCPNTIGAGSGSSLLAYYDAYNKYCGLITSYDANGNDRISSYEVLAAVSDYLEGVISEEALNAVLSCYYSGGSIASGCCNTSDGTISSDEVLEASVDYFDGKICYQELSFLSSCCSSGGIIGLSSGCCPSGGYCRDECGSSECLGTFYNDCYDSDGDGCTESHWDNCSDCSCSCGGYGEEESSGNGNCSDGLDNDCDGNTDAADSGCIANFPPRAGFSCSIAGCYAYSGSADPKLDLINGSTDPDGQEDIAESEWDILDHSGDESICFGLCDYTVQSTLLAPGDHQVQLTVTDSADQSDDFVLTVNIKQDAVADFLCSLYEDGPWQDCSDFKGVQKEYSYFKDASSVSEDASFIESRVWELNGSVFASGVGTDPVSTSSAEILFATNLIEMTVVDDQGREDTASYTIGSKLPLPTWREIAP